MTNKEHQEKLDFSCPHCIAKELLAINKKSNHPPLIDFYSILLIEIIAQSHQSLLIKDQQIIQQNILINLAETLARRVNEYAHSKPNDATIN